MLPVQNLIIGTAGHIDHGKTCLTQALTGIDTDKLPEEKERGISIALGIAPLSLPSITASIIDVPGHEKFIGTMLGGTVGINMFLLVISADDGIMPQTLEHWQILFLLNITTGIIVITKCDLASQQQITDLKTLIRQKISSTLPIVEVSVLTGTGIATLKEQIYRLALTITVKHNPVTRLPIDKVFSLPGQGTIVTGTLWGGTITKNDTLMLYPSGKTVRIRGLQNHGQEENTAFTGQRVALNLHGVEKAAISRGSWLAAPNLLTATNKIDIQLQLLPTAQPLKNNLPLHIYHGTAHHIGRLQLLELTMLPAGAKCFARITLEKELFALLGDQLILRSYSPMSTIGKGTILDLQPQRQKKILTIEHLRQQATKSLSLADMIQNSLTTPLFSSQLTQLYPLAAEQLPLILADLAAKKAIILLDNLIVDAQQFTTLHTATLQHLHEYHQQHPLAVGITSEQLRLQVNQSLSVAAWKVLLKHWQQEIGKKNDVLYLIGFQPVLTAEQQETAAQIMQIYTENLFAPPNKEEFMHTSLFLHHQDLFYYLLRQQQLIAINKEFIFHHQAIEQARDKLNQHFQHQAELTLNQAKVLFGTSRKYLIPLLEYFDQLKLTVRVGTNRKSYK